MQERECTQAELDNIKAYVNHYAPTKKFDKDKAYIEYVPGNVLYVQGCTMKQNDSRRICYRHDGFFMSDHCRVTTKKGDTDSFREIIVSVDGKTVYEYDG